MRKDPKLNTGNKGIGFKAVFRVTDCPVIYSKVNNNDDSITEKVYWKFHFLKGKDDDELSFVTPTYLDYSELPSQLKLQIQTSENEIYNTFIFLPLKAEFKNEKFLTEFIETVDRSRYVLMFSKFTSKSSQ